MENQLTAEIIAALSRPFPLGDIEVKPGAVRQDSAEALALAYADWRSYAERLDTIIGPTGWSIQLIPWGPTRVIARLTIFGITKDSSGEGDHDDEHCGTIAEAQAKKRACAEFGLGRYLYNLPRIWGKGQGDRKSFRFHEPRRIVEKMYDEAGLLQQPATSPPMIKPVPDTNGLHQPQRNGAIAPDPTRLATARQVLAEAEQTTTLPPPSGELATQKQCGAMLALIGRCAEFDIDVSKVDTVGSFYGVARLSSIRKMVNIPTTLTKQNASALIGDLDKLVKAAQG